MNAIKTIFSDMEVLSYGRHREFTFNEEGSLLKAQNSEPGHSEDLLKAVKQIPSYDVLADYVTASFMNPKMAVKIFADSHNSFLRLRAALPYSEASNAAFAMLYSAGNDGSYLGCENKETAIEMAIELSGVKDGEVSPISFEISPMVMLIILAACDVALQNKYEGGWFTAASIMNAFDLWGDRDFVRVCAPLADVAGDCLYSSISEEELNIALGKMTKGEIFESDEIDGKTLYSFTLEYRNILNIFSNTKNRMALAHYNESGYANIIYTITNEDETWAFTIQNGDGKIEKIDKKGLKKILDMFFVAQGNQEAVANTKTPKFCADCGSPLNAGAKFCGGCGIQIK